MITKPLVNCIVSLIVLRAIRKVCCNNNGWMNFLLPCYLDDNVFDIPADHGEGLMNDAVPFCAFNLDRIVGDTMNIGIGSCALHWRLIQ